MTVHFFPKDGRRSATARYRAFLLAEELDKKGLKTIVHRPPTWRSAFRLSFARLRELINNFKILKSLQKEDVIYLVRTVYQIDFFLLILFFKIFFKRKLIFDFDDPLFLRKRLKLKMKLLTRLADAVFVGSHYLADWARQYNKNVYLIPTSVPLDIYEKNSRSKKDSIFTLGWVGIGPNHYENFKILLPAFKKLLELKINFKFILVGSLGDQKIKALLNQVTGLNVEYVDELDWQEPANVVRQIGRFDVGLMPLADNQANRGKCAFKAIEYMSCSVPAVISPVGENKYLIQDGFNGFLAETAYDWSDKIKRLFENPELAKSLGVRGLETIRQGYSYKSLVPKIIKIIKELR